MNAHFRFEFPSDARGARIFTQEGKGGVEICMVARSLPLAEHLLTPKKDVDDVLPRDHAEPIAHDGLVPVCELPRGFGPSSGR